MRTANQRGLRAIMARLEQAASPFGMAVAGVARRTSLNVRITVIVCLVLIAASFAGAAALQMRLDRVRALSQARWYEALRARDIGAAAGASLDRFADAGRSFADGGSPSIAGLRNVALFDSSGVWSRVLRGSAVDFPDLPVGWLEPASRGNALLSAFLLAFPYGQKVVVVYFDPASLVPPSMLERATMLAPDGRLLAGAASPTADVAAEARVRHWPAVLQTYLDASGA